MMTMIFSLVLSICAANEPSIVKTLSKDCLDRELDLWEQKMGRLPNADEADLIIDMCVEQAFEAEKEQKNAKSK